MNSSFDASGTQFAWDATSLDLWFTCPRKYYYRIIENWQPMTPSVHLLFGGVYASALERFHKLRAEGMSFDDAEAEVVHLALHLSWADGAPMEFLDNAKTRDNLIRTIIWYLEQFRDDVLVTYIASDGKPAVEFSFSLPVEDGIILTGHIDRLVTYGDDIYVTDNKTTGSTITPRFFRQFDSSLQMSQYTFAGKIIYSLPVSGVIIDAAQIAVGFSRFERGFTFRTEPMLEEWLDNIQYTITQAREATLKQRFPMNLTSCSKYAGCEFEPICTKDPRVRGNFLKADFTQERPRWDPLKRR